MRTERLEAREQQILAKLRHRPRLTGQHITETIYCNVKAFLLARLSATGDIPPTPFDDASLLRMLIGTGMGQVLEEGYVSQIQTISADSQDVGTIDIWMKDHPVEIKVTYLSTSRDIAQQAHWLEQLGEYVCRATDSRRNPWGELWIVHLLGDHGKKRCAEHGVPDEVFKRKHPETDRPRLACPTCWEFLEDGDRNTTLRCHRVEWTWAELESLHSIHASRQQQLQEDILNPDLSPSNLPAIKWGYQAEFECNGCPFFQQQCPGIDGSDDLEAQLQGSILGLEIRKGAKV